MAKRLKGFIVGMTNVAFTAGQIDRKKLAEVERLLEFLLGNGVQPVIFGNREWFASDSTTGKQSRIQDALDGVWKDIPWIIANRDGTPQKPTAEAVEYLLNQFGWDAAETVYLGNTVDDMKTAVNGGVLFLNAIWHGQTCEYGFVFDSPLDVARFVDTFCLREHLWHYAIESDDLRYYALSPYSTRLPEFEYLSNDARAAAKRGQGHPDFWTRYIWSTLYFSELYKDVDYITAYPGHLLGAGNAVVDEPMVAFSRCFRKTYLRDFIHRHTQSQKSSEARIRNLPIGHANQLNTIKLEKYPLRGDGTKRYKNCPIKPGKTLLVIDDICTNGYSLEAARAFIKQTGANVVCMSWLKTINSDYKQITTMAEFDPFSVARFAGDPPSVSHPYRNKIVDPMAPDEVTQKLRSYDAWNWP